MYPLSLSMLLHSGRSYLAISTTSRTVVVVPAWCPAPGAARNTSPPKLGHVINKHIVSSVSSVLYHPYTICSLRYNWLNICNKSKFSFRLKILICKFNRHIPALLSSWQRLVVVVGETPQGGEPFSPMNIFSGTPGMSVLDCCLG